jgi:alkylhydroperoxidase/carboxymuconolactone decarboxylase family protein YurZ
MSLLDPADRTRTGVRHQTEVLAAPAPEPQTLLQGSWRDFIFAEVWSRPQLDRRSRYLIAMSGSARAQDADALEGYVRGALTGGELSLSELREAALHVAVYSGWSVGGCLDAAITRVANALGLPPATTPPIRAEAWDPQQRIEQGKAGFVATMVFGGPPPNTAYFEAGILNFVFAEMWNAAGSGSTRAPLADTGRRLRFRCQHTDPFARACGDGERQYQPRRNERIRIAVRGPRRLAESLGGSGRSTGAGGARGKRSAVRSVSRHPPFAGMTAKRPKRREQA